VVPVESTALDSRLQVRYQVGVNEADEPVYSLRTLANVRSDSADENLWSVVSAVAGLRAYPIAEVRRIDNTMLTES